MHNSDWENELRQKLGIYSFSAFSPQTVVELWSIYSKRKREFCGKILPLIKELSCEPARMADAFRDFEEFLGLAYEIGDEVQNKLEKDRNHYPYIPSHPPHFCNVVAELKRRHPEFSTFLDIGSGLGEKVFLAHFLGFSSSVGIEYNIRTFTIAEWKKELYGLYNGEVKFRNQDAFKCKNFNGKFVYLYVPINNPPLMLDLYRHILNNMENGLLWDIHNWSFLGFLGEDFPEFREEFYETGGEKDFYLLKKDGKVSLEMFDHQIRFQKPQYKEKNI